MRGEGVKDIGNCLPERSERTGGGLTEERLDFGEGLFDGIEVRTIGRQITKRSPGGFDSRADSCTLVAGQIVHHDEVVAPERRAQYLRDISKKGGAVHGAVKHPGRGEAVLPQGGGEGGCWPVPPRFLAPQTVTGQATAITARHIGGGAGLIDQHQPRRIEPGIDCCSIRSVPL